MRGDVPGCASHDPIAGQAHTVATHKHVWRSALALLFCLAARAALAWFPTLICHGLRGAVLRVFVLQSALAVGGRRVKVAVLDHVVSFPPLVLPVAAMAAACKQASCRTASHFCHTGPNWLPSFSGAASCCWILTHTNCNQMHRGLAIVS